MRPISRELTGSARGWSGGVAAEADEGSGMAVTGGAARKASRSL